MKQKPFEQYGKKSIFRSLFVPLFLIMLLQAFIFYLAAVYGGIEESLSQNAADILSERLDNRKNEIETLFNNDWADLSGCDDALDALYDAYAQDYGAQPLAQNPQRQVLFLQEASDTLIQTLRQNEVNGIFLILNDQTVRTDFAADSGKKYGLCIRDIDQRSNYFAREDLLLERAPSSIVEAIDCSLDSWWEARYSFSSAQHGDYYYYPLRAAWDNPGAAGSDLAYFSGAHQISSSDQSVVSYSLPLMDKNGYPYAVLGIELTTQYLASLLPNEELHDLDQCCYVLTLQDADTLDCMPIVGTGALYSRCFDHDAPISCANVTGTGGFAVTGRGNIALYGDAAPLNIYNNNNPFEAKRLTLLALVESRAMFAYIGHIKQTLLFVSLISLFLGVIGILLVSRHFAAPITALARRVRSMKPEAGFQLERLGIAEIDQLVDSIEVLNRNVSKDIARTEFYSRMSHDMRTPMNAIITFSSQELLTDADEALKNDYLEKIHTSGVYLLGLINEVLDMTKIESNQTQLHYEPIQAARLWETTIPIVEKLAQKKNIRFTHAISGDQSMYVLVDEQHLNQIVINLLSNAVKFTPANGAVRFDVTLSDEAGDPEQTHCRLVVSDDGIGMSEVFMKTLYTPFEQENKDLEGTGLGLSIAKKLVELMGGSIQCVSRKHEGTTFTIDLSLRKCAAPSPGTDAANGSQAPDAYASLHGKRILLCEDHPINTEIASRLLQKKGIVVETTSNGQLGVERFASSAPGSFDAILMDIRMPVMDGLTAARAIRALPRPDAATIPIIAMTANAFNEDALASKAAGMNAHLSKPIEPATLYSTLATLIAAKASD